MQRDQITAMFETTLFFGIAVLFGAALLSELHAQPQAAQHLVAQHGGTELAQTNAARQS